MGLQLVWIQVHRNGSGFAAIRQGNGCPLYGCELRTNKIGSKVIKFLLGKFPSAYAKLQHRHVGRVVAENIRWSDTCRQRFKNRLTRRRSFSDGGIHTRMRLQVDLDNIDTIERVGFDMLNIIDRSGQCPLGDSRNSTFHFLGRHAIERPKNTDDWDVNCRENILRHLQRAECAPYPQSLRDNLPNAPTRPWSP